MGGGARSAPFGLPMGPKMGARSARARKRGQNPYICIIVSYICLGYFVCLCVCECVCVTIAERSDYSFCFSKQTDRGDKTEGLEMEGLEI